MRRAFLLSFVIGCAAPTTPPPAAPVSKSPTVANQPAATVTPATLPPLVTSPQAKVTLSLDRPGVRFLGENVLVHYCVENTTAAPLTYSVGGDYRGANRSTRFELVAYDARGKPKEDPDPEHFNFGGLGYQGELGPHASWCASLPLGRYARIDAPGTYTLRARHDLGWAKDVAPQGEVKVTFAMPNEKEAEDVVAAMERLAPYEPITMGKLAAPYRDFSTLAYPVYLPALVRRTSLDAVDGIGAVPSVDATRALISLVDGPHGVEAAKQLAFRLPNPSVEKTYAARRYIVRLAWEPSLASEVRTAAVKQVAGDDDERVRSGADLLEGVGTPQDRDAVVQAFGRTIERTKTAPLDMAMAPTPRVRACEALGRAVEALRTRGAPLPDAPTATGELAAWLIAVRHDARPPNWETTLRRALAHSNGYVRRLALAAIPSPAPPAFVPLIATNLASNDVDAQRGAVEVVQQSQLRSLAAKTGALAGTAEDYWVREEAWRVAQALGGTSAAAEAVTARLRDPKSAKDAAKKLFELLEIDRLNDDAEVDPRDLAKLAAPWTTFLRTKRAAIDSGKKLPLDASVPKSLVPKGWKLLRDGQPSWP